METTRTIVVTNLPEFNDKKLKDKLEIHFGRRGNGGGDVDQIVVTEQCGLIGTLALITFAEKETVASVLVKQHIFFGKTLKVEPHLSTEEEQGNTDNSTPKKVRLARLPQLPSQDLKLIVHGRYAENVLQSTAQSTNATLQVDEKSTKFCLEGPPVAIVQAVDIFGNHNTQTKTQPQGSGNDRQRKNIVDWTTPLQRREQRPKELIDDKRPLKIISAVEKHADADHHKILNNSPGSLKKDVSKLRRKANKLPANNKKLSRNIVKFDPKVLSYVQAVKHRVITEAGDRFHVDFEAKADGQVEFKSRGQNTDQQKIKESMKFVENFVNGIQKMGLVTETIRLMQFKEAPKQKVDEAVKQTLQSTDVLVTLKASSTLEFYGTERGVHHEIEKLRAGILGRELQTDGDSQCDNEQTVYNQRNGDGTLHPHEETGSRATVGYFRAKNYSKHPERLASLDEDIKDESSAAQGVQFKKSVDAPARKLFVRPLATLQGSSVLDDVQLSFAENLVDRQTYRSPAGPPTWKEENYPSLCSVTHNEISYPPNEAKEENKASKQSWRPVELPVYFNDDSLPDEQNKSSDMVSEQEVVAAKPKVTFVDMNQGAYSPPMQQSRLQGAVQVEDDEKASHSCQNDDSTRMVEMSLDEVDGAGALLMTDGAMVNGAVGEMLDMEPSPSCLPPKESSRGRDSPMEINPIPVKTSAAVPSPRRSLLVGWPLVDLSWGSASVGNSRGGIPGLYDTVSQSEDFTVQIRTGMKVIIRQGDITNEFTDVIVTSADPHLHLNHGVGRAVREAAGQELVRACRNWTSKNGPVDCGKNVWTVGGNLKCSHVLHVVLKQSQGGTELKQTFMDLLKTCSHSLQASHVSMPAIGVDRMSVSKKAWARAFFEAVCEITQLYDKGWMQLSTLVLVDRNRALIEEVKKVFENPTLSGSFEENVQSVRQQYPVSGMRNSFTGSGAFNVPRLRARGPSGVQNGVSRRGFSTTQPSNYWTFGQTTMRKDSMDDMPVDPDDKCAICLDRIKKERKLRCKHRFCRQCLDKALKVHNYCPLCRQPVR